jgi:hypothetical protein
VCGARRTKAAELAGLELVPCNVAELTDDQAIEAAITENLQRQDVHPMEEARAFAALLERGYTLQQLGERFGKSHVHIWNRVQLAKATAELQEAIEAGKIPLTYARELAKFPDFVQAEELEDKGWAYKRDPKQYFESLMIDYTVDLSAAPFDTIAAGCNDCPFQAAALGLTKTEFRCANKAKYREHVMAHIIEMLAADPDLKCVAFSHSHADAVKIWADKLPANRVILKLYWTEAYDYVYKPEMPEYEEPDAADYDTTEAYELAVLDARGEYKSDYDKYLIETAEYEKKLAVGPRGILMSSGSIGEVVLLEANNNASARKAQELEQIDGSDEDAAEKLALKEQISTAKERANRLPALGEEKAYEAAIEQINGLAIYKGIDTTDAQPALLTEEMDAFYLCLLEKLNYQLPINLRTALFGKDGYFNKEDKQINAALALKQQIWPLLVRKFLQRDFQPAEGKGTGNLTRYAWDKIAWALEDVDYNQVADVRQSYRAKRAKVTARIKELEAAYQLLEKEVAQ